MYCTKDSNSNSTSDLHLSWKDDLLKLLETTPRAIIGEIGLDKAAKVLFILLFLISCRLQKPASVNTTNRKKSSRISFKLQ